MGILNLWVFPVSEATWEGSEGVAYFLAHFSAPHLADKVKLKEGSIDTFRLLLIPLYVHIYLQSIISVLLILLVGPIRLLYREKGIYSDKLNLSLSSPKVNSR